MRHNNPELGDATLNPRQTSESLTSAVKLKEKRASLSFWLIMCGVYALLIALAAYLSLFFAVNTKASSQSNEQTASIPLEQTDTTGTLAFTYRIAFANSVQTHIATRSAIGGSPTVLTQYPPGGSEPTWSPDGTKIAFNASGQIWVINADGSNRTFPISSPDYKANPSWSVTGKIAYERGASFDPQSPRRIWVANADGSNQVLFPGISFTTTIAPAWSPDGSKLAFVSNGEIYVINADGSGERRLTINSTVDDDPSWSPDGLKIVFSRSMGGLAVINADGTNEVGLGTGNDASEPAWSPDGTKIAFVRNGLNVAGIYLMNSDGTNQVMSYGGSTPTGFGFVNIYDTPAWKPLPALPSRPLFDFDGDGKADVSVFRPSNGFWYLLNSQTGFSTQQFGTATDKITPADYDGDGKTDVAVWRPAAGDESRFFILNSSSNTVRTELFALIGDIPLAADWDGDGRADPAAYRNGAGGGQSYFFYRPSSQPVVNFITVPWGAGGDKPIVGDYDSDGKADAAVFRPNNGGWYVRLSSNGAVYTVQFGVSDDIPVTGDFDGDGKTDVSIFRPSNGGWYRLNSANGQFFAIQFGAMGDLPVAVDYDGDGKADVSVFRPASGTWYHLNSGNGQFSAVQFGTTGDIPTPAAYIQ